MDKSSAEADLSAMRRLEVLFALLVASFGCQGQSEPEASPQPRPVRTAEAQTRPSDAAVWLPGRAQSTETPELSFRVPGRVSMLAVDVGNSVEAGQTVARLEAEDFRARVSQAEAEVARARAEAERTRRAAERAQALYEGEATSESNRDQTRELAQAAAAQLEAAKQRLSIAERELDYTRLVAHQSGVVVERHAEVGGNVSVGQAILTLGSAVVEVRVDVPETIIDTIQVGDAARVRKNADREGQAKVRRVARATAGLGSLYPVILGDAELALAPGMAVEVQFPDLGNGDDFLVVPSTAVVADEDGTFVWTLDAAEDSQTEKGEALYRAKAVRVAFSHMEGPSAFLQSGLEPEQTVVTAGTRYLKEGMLVREARLPPLVPESSEGRLDPFVSRRSSAEAR